MPEPETGFMPRQLERRKAPRRTDDVSLHYARENLLAAALTVADARAGRGPHDVAGWLLVLDSAAEQYRRAESVAVPS